MRKRCLSIIFVAGLLLSVLGGCGGAKEDAAPVSGMTGYEDPGESAAGEPEEMEEPYVPKLPEGVERSDIFVTKIDGIPDDFIRGMDISSLIAEEESGVRYHDEEGNEEDLLKILADAGLNYVRVRVWNDPYDEEGRSYGGGHCDLDTAVKIGQRAAKYGLKTCVDFHYSDFWADPGKQMSPKAWKKMTTDEKLEAIAAYTKESLKILLDNGVDVAMVQVGNETNNGIAGIRNEENTFKMIAAGCKAVREFSEGSGKKILTAVHFTQIDDHDGTLKKAEGLKKAGADYDVFGVSYYTYWHGDFENMKRVLTDIRETYGVDTCVMETAYPYTDKEGDGTGNSIAGDTDPVDGYPVSVEGQAKNLRDVMASANEAGALGVFYWEGAWIPVGSEPEENRQKWEEFGSGWASSFAASYDPNDAGKYYGGSSWDNQALFDFEGYPLPSLNVFKYVKYGTDAPVRVMALKKTEMESPLGVPITLPDTVEAVYNDSDRTEGVPVKWNEEEAAAVNVNEPGRYRISGVADFEGDDISHEAELSLKIAAVNYLKNGSFEEEDTSMWVSSFSGDSDPVDIQDKAADASDGSKALHYWSTAPLDFRVSQKIPEGTLPSGTYTASCVAQGGDLGDDGKVWIYVIKEDGSEEEGEKTGLTGWKEWKDLTVTFEISEGEAVEVGVAVRADAKGWGTFDEMELFLSGS
ncbi:MAG: glycosyl hydrolase 53 family protein [Lachnospiraceae bacterium]|nr:glycosyl hydrolase 53 family protein [Lachnospiraceae bacterium]